MSWKVEIEEGIPGDGYGGDTTGLSDGDFRVTAAVKHLRELSALAGTGFSDDDGNRVVLYGLDDFFFVLDNGKGCHPRSYSFFLLSSSFKTSGELPMGNTAPIFLFSRKYPN